MYKVTVSVGSCDEFIVYEGTDIEQVIQVVQKEKEKLTPEEVLHIKMKTPSSFLNYKDINPEHLTVSSSIMDALITTRPHIRTIYSREGMVGGLRSMNFHDAADFFLEFSDRDYSIAIINGIREEKGPRKFGGV